MQTSQKIFTWKPDANIVITGVELNVIANGLAHARAAHEMLQDIMTRATLAGIIESKYIGEDGVELSEDDVNKLAEVLTEQIEKELPQMG